MIASTTTRAPAAALRTAGILVLASACTGTGPLVMDAGTDASAVDTGIHDAGSTPDTGPMDAGRTADGTMCAPPLHQCGDRCELDQRIDSPEVGCRLGCGDPCPEPDGGRAICEDGRCAVQMCLTCETAEAQCGQVSDQCGALLDCGTCSAELRCDAENQCAECSDDLEGNDSQEAATELGEYGDIPNSNASFRHVSLHDVGDVDWYHARIEDRGDTVFGTGGPPNITVTVSGWPEGLSPTLSATFTCDGGRTTTVACDRGATAGANGCADDVPSGGELEILLDIDCEPNDGNDADGDLFIQVGSTANPAPDVCGIYTLRLSVR